MNVEECVGGYFADIYGSLISCSVSEAVLYSLLYFKGFVEGWGARAHGLVVL